MELTDEPVEWKSVGVRSRVKKKSSFYTSNIIVR